MSKARAGAKAKRAWQRMLSGRRLDLLDPSPLDVELDDITHGLARVARWNGQTKGAHIYSVAQHALLVEALARVKAPRLDPAARLAVLLHDAPEYVIGDMISPFKAVIGDNYKAVEYRLLTAIHLRFGLPATLPDTLQKLIKAADRAADLERKRALLDLAQRWLWLATQTDAIADRKERARVAGIRRHPATADDAAQHHTGYCRLAVLFRRLRPQRRK